jgi:cation transport ATPase
MTGPEDIASPACPQCGKPIDPLRAPAVSVLDGRMTYFCSSTCRQKHLNRSELSEIEEKDMGRSASEEPPPSPREETSLEPALLVPPEGTGSLYRSKLLVHQMAQTAVFVAIAVAVFLVPALLDDYFRLALAGLGILLHAGIAVRREHHSSVIRVLNALSSAVASTSVLASALFGLSFRTAAVGASLLLVIESLGHLLELVSRHRSGILMAVEGGHELSLPSSWRDNSKMASDIQTAGSVIQWGRYPAAAIVGLAAFVISKNDPMSALLAGAAALLAIDPRPLRMATGDAHLRASLLASTRGIGIRDAFVLGEMARADVALFVAGRSIEGKALSVVDWKLAEGADESDVLDALHAMELNAEGRVAAAVSRYTRSRKARASSPVSVEKQAHRGIKSDTPWGTILCGSRRLLLENGVPTALMEPHAATIEASGRQAVFMAMAGRLAAVFGIEAPIAPEVEEMTLKLQQMGVTPQLLTSADVQAGTALGGRLGFETVHFDTPEEQMGEVLEQLRESGNRVVLIGHGAAFEENLRSAQAAIAVLGAEPTQAGVDARRARLADIPWLVEIVRRADRSARVHLVTAMGSALAGLGFALTWFAPGIALTTAVMTTLAALSCTLNAPFPLLNRLTRAALLPLRQLLKLSARLRSAPR